MKNMLKRIGTAAGILGCVVCLAAVAGRFYGEPLFLGWAASHVLLLGAAILVFACWSKLESA
jgi:hypothetical protein